MNSKIKWCVEQHADTNHMYDGYLPYEFHLRSVVSVFHKFKHLLQENLLTSETNEGRFSETYDSTLEDVEIACWAHDLIEDARVSYNDVKRKLDFNVAEIVYALTNEKGRDRSERANERYYEGIRKTPGAVFVKLCDRIANVEYSLDCTSPHMLNVYSTENKHFLESLGVDSQHPYAPMAEYLNDLFADAS